MQLWCGGMLEARRLSSHRGLPSCCMANGLEAEVPQGRSTRVSMGAASGVDQHMPPRPGAGSAIWINVI